MRLFFALLAVVSICSADIPCSELKSFIETAGSNTEIDGGFYTFSYSRVLKCEDLVLRNDGVLKPYRVVHLELETQGDQAQLPQFAAKLSNAQSSNHLQNIIEMTQNSETVIHVSSISPYAFYGSGIGGYYQQSESYENRFLGGTFSWVFKRDSEPSGAVVLGLPGTYSVKAKREGYFKENMFPWITKMTFQSVYIHELKNYSTPTPTPKVTGTPTSTPTPSVTGTITPTPTIDFEGTPEVCEEEKGSDAEIIESTPKTTKIEAPPAPFPLQYKKGKDLALTKGSEQKANPIPGSICPPDDRYEGLSTLSKIAEINLAPDNYFRDLALIGRGKLHACNLFVFAANARYAWNLKERSIINMERYLRIVGGTRKGNGFIYDTPFAHQTLASFKNRGFKCLRRNEFLKSVHPLKTKAGVSVIRNPRSRGGQGHVAIYSYGRVFEASYSWRKAKTIRGYRGSPARSRSGTLNGRNNFQHACWLPEQEEQFRRFFENG